VFEGTIDDRLGTPGIIAVSLIAFGVLLGWADRSTGQRKIEGFGPRDALITGAAQTLALNPGTSRSGITVTAGRFLGFDRDAAVRISFLMSLPVIAGAVLFKTFGAIQDGIPEDLIVPMIVGIVTSGIAGWLAVWGTLRLVRNHSLMLFVWYRIILGTLILLVMATGLR
jgi:undecaprenyl-diphosphatase